MSVVIARANLIVSAFALAGAVFMLKGKQIIISMMGVILLMVSVIVNYVTIEQYAYGFTDIMLLSEVSIIIFAILSGILVLTSKKEFA